MSELNNHDPFSIPEILDLIASYLPKNDLLSCIQTNQSWRTLFLPYLWENMIFDYKSYKRGLSELSIEPYSHLIKSVLVTENQKFESMVSQCCNLQSLQIVLPHGRLIGSAQMSTTLPPTLPIVQLCLSNLCLDWGSITRVTKLKDLTISECFTSEYSSTTDFWDQQSFPLLESLRLINVNIPELNDIVHIPLFPNIRTLELDFMSRLSDKIQLEIVKKCPNLETFRFRGNRFRSITRDIVQCAVDGSWPRLRSLHLDCQAMSTQNVIDLLNSLQLLLQWDVSYFDFDQSCFQALETHFSTLTRVNFAYCQDATSQMLLTILTSCPMLTRFRGCVMDPKDIVRSKQWVCTSLMTFSVYIDWGAITEDDVVFVNDSTADSSEDYGLEGEEGEGEEGEEGEGEGEGGVESNHDIDEQTENNIQAYHKLIFQRIGRLHNLRILLIGIDPENIGLLERKKNQPGVRFKLGEGLEFLGGLKKLEIVGMIERDELSDGETEWMKTHWKRLSQIEGSK